MSKILCDLDGVVVDLLPAWLAEYARCGGEFLQVSDMKSYWFQDSVKDVSLFMRSLDRALEKALPIPGAISSINALRKAGHEVYFLTYAHTKYAPFAHHLKLRWLTEWFGEPQDDWCIFTKHKHLVLGDYFFDDSKPQIEKWEDYHKHGHAFLFDQPYNKKADRLLYNWEMVQTRFGVAI